MKAGISSPKGDEGLEFLQELADTTEGEFIIGKNGDAGLLII